MLDKIRWNSLIKNITGISSQDGLFLKITAAYSESHRHYHSSKHIEHCLNEFDAVKNLCEAPDEVELAIWLHDLAYNPHASDNEEMSALLAKEILAALHCPENKSNNIQELILATKHVQRPASADGQLVADIDLSIFGQPPDIYHLYEKDIRAEYAWVSEKVYKIERSKILYSFLSKPSIYYTKRFEKLYGTQARINLTKAVTTLAL